MTGRLLPTILILPGTVLVLVPAIVFWAAAGTGYAGNWAGLGQGQLWAGVGSLAAGLLLAGWTLRLFATVGQGTPAPWDPPQKLVVRGPYRHVRNPMISSVLLMLAGEALLYQSWPLAAWGLLFFAANAVYFPLSEEKGLERRFGGDYRTYKANVPRWFPRIRPWQPADE